MHHSSAFVCGCVCGKLCVLKSFKEGCMSARVDEIERGIRWEFAYCFR